jgi:hypothetical protein
MTHAYQAVRRKRVGAQMLQLRMLPENWLADPASPHDDYFRAVTEQVLRFDCNCWLVACGFNKNGEPQMYSVDNPDHPRVLKSIVCTQSGKGRPCPRTPAFNRSRQQYSAGANALSRLPCEGGRRSDPRCRLRTGCRGSHRLRIRPKSRSQ